MQIETIKKDESDEKSCRLRELTGQEKEKARKRFEEIRQAPNPGRLARKLRKRLGLSVEELGEITDIDPSLIEMFERSGSLRIWAEGDSGCAGFDEMETLAWKG